MQYSHPPAEQTAAHRLPDAAHATPLPRRLAPRRPTVKRPSPAPRSSRRCNVRARGLLAMHRLRAPPPSTAPLRAQARPQQRCASVLPPALQLLREHATAQLRRPSHPAASASRRTELALLAGGEGRREDARRATKKPRSGPSAALRRLVSASSSTQPAASKNECTAVEHRWPRSTEQRVSTSTGRSVSSVTLALRCTRVSPKSSPLRSHVDCRASARSDDSA